MIIVCDSSDIVAVVQVPNEVMIRIMSTVQEYNYIKDFPAIWQLLANLYYHGTCTVFVVWSTWYKSTTFVDLATAVNLEID
jgi:hypothetical protein